MWFHSVFFTLYTLHTAHCLIWLSTIAGRYGCHQCERFLSICFFLQCVSPCASSRTVRLMAGGNTGLPSGALQMSPCLIAPFLFPHRRILWRGFTLFLYYHIYITFWTTTPDSLSHMVLRTPVWCHVVWVILPGLVSWTHLRNLAGQFYKLFKPN